jgi:stage II sporulation protein E
MALMTCETKPSYNLTGAYASCPRSDDVSGDIAKVFKSKDLFAYGLICDGMGSGNEAKFASEITSNAVETVLSSGAYYKSSVKIANSILRRGEECSVALDLFSLDLISGEASFIKSGAAPSYIKRGASLFRIKSETMPLGVMRTVDAEKIDAEVAAGDYVVMLSDGIFENGEDMPWLVSLLNSAPEPDLKSYAERILKSAKSELKNRGKAPDDMTVLVLSVGAVE